MDERVLFERLHDALDIEPHPGAYERLRIALEKRSAQPQRRAAFQLRGPKMGLRVAAGLAVILLAVVIVAAFLVAHNAPTGSVPAGSGQTILAYQNLVAGDYGRAVNTWTAPCDTTQHAGCQADATSAGVALRQWLVDLNRSEPPARFAVVDAQLRQHLAESIAGLNALLAAIQAQDQQGMNRAYLMALSGRIWVDTVVPSIVFTQQVTAATYTTSVRAQKQSLGCINCQQLLGPSQITCSANQTPTCQDLVEGTASLISSFQAALVQFAAPGSLSAKDSRLQQDLAQADSALIAMTTAVSTGDQSGFDTGRTSLQRAVAAVDHDATAILNS